MRGLLWRSHPEAMNFGEGENLSFSRVVNEAGGQVLLDQRVRRGGSHHQKLVVVRRADPPPTSRSSAGSTSATAAVTTPGTSATRRPSTSTTRTTAIGRRGTTCSSSSTARPSMTSRAPSRNGGTTPPRSTRATRCAPHSIGSPGIPTTPGPLADQRAAPGDGPLAVQVLRTYPARRQPYPFAPHGERSIARAYLKAFARARRLSTSRTSTSGRSTPTRVLCESLAAHPDLHIVVVIPRYPDPDGAVAGEASRIGRERVLDALHDGGHERVAVYDLENDAGTPIYVHSKVCVIDDVWIAIGSDNLNRRSWTHDSELSCAVIDDRLTTASRPIPVGSATAPGSSPATPASASRPSTSDAADDVADLVDPTSWFEALRAGADALDAWHRFGAGRGRPGTCASTRRSGCGARAGGAAASPSPAARPRRTAAGVAAPRRVLTPQSRSAASSASAGRGSASDEDAVHADPAGGHEVALEVVEEDGALGIADPEPVERGEEDRGIGLAHPFLATSRPRVEQLVDRQRARHASPYSRTLLVTMAVRRLACATARTASTTTRAVDVVDDACREHLAHVEPACRRPPASALIARERVRERDLAPLEPVPGMVGSCRRNRRRSPP